MSVTVHAQTLGIRILDSIRLTCERSVGGKGIQGLVSIPIATYDRAEILVSRTLPSLLRQTYPHIEIIVVSDGGPKNVGQAVLALSDPRIRFFQLKKRSRYPSDPLSLWLVAGSKARNLGARHARGQFILWISDDDILMPDAIENLVNFLILNPKIDAVGGTVQIGTKNPTLNNPRDNPEKVGFETAAMPGWLHRRHLRAFRWNVRSWKKKWNRPVDYDLSERMLRRKIRFGAIHDIVALQVEVGDSGKVGSEGAVWEELRRREQHEKD